MGEVIAKKMRDDRREAAVGHGEPHLGHRRYMSGAATNPDPEVFAYAAAQVKNALELTHDLGGANYALWGGREGYETLLNTDLKRELDQLGRFLSLVVEHKHKIGFKGTILIEPKPARADQAPVRLRRRDGLRLPRALRPRAARSSVNIEQNHALLAGHSFEHEIALAQALGVFGSIDMNRGDELLGWDTDQFPNNLPQMALALYHILRGGGFTTGGLNFDAKVRRQSIDPEDLLHGPRRRDRPVRARAARGREDDRRRRARARTSTQRYAGWNGKLGREHPRGQEVARPARRRTSNKQRSRAAAALGPAGAPRRRSSTAISDRTRHLKVHMKKTAAFFEQTEPFAFRYYKPEKKVLGKRMADHLRFAVCYWHSFVLAGHSIPSAARPSCAPGTRPAATR